jgi:MATE family multidrug resistance protein
MWPSPALSAETRRILSLAWPVMLTSLNWTILHVTDVIVVGLTGTEQVAALGASRSLTFPGIVMGLGALTGVLVHVSRADGARRPARKPAACCTRACCWRLRSGW